MSDAILNDLGSEKTGQELCLQIRPTPPSSDILRLWRPDGPSSWLGPAPHATLLLVPTTAKAGMWTPLVFLLALVLKIALAYAGCDMIQNGGLERYLLAAQTGKLSMV
jgi:hypothetical protein